MVKMESVIPVQVHYTHYTCYKRYTLYTHSILLLLIKAYTLHTHVRYFIYCYVYNYILNLIVELASDWLSAGR